MLRGRSHVTVARFSRLRVARSNGVMDEGTILRIGILLVEARGRTVGVNQLILFLKARK
jgi:hypothetical protein